MLADQKRGWQGRSGGVVAASARKYSSSRTKSSSRRSRGSGGTEGSDDTLDSILVMPTDCRQFQRVWRRRCATDDARRDYLRFVGAKRFEALFRVEMEPDLLGQVLMTICSGFPSFVSVGKPSKGSSMDSQSQESAEGSGRCDEGNEGTPPATQLSAHPAIECMQWLSSFSRTGRFRININFLEKREKRAIADLFECLRALLVGHGEANDSALRSLQETYSL